MHTRPIRNAFVRTSKSPVARTVFPSRHTSAVATDDPTAVSSNTTAAAITPATRVLIVNSPNNPTGWTLSRAEQAEILAHCRSTGTWVLADEVYERLYYETDTANGCAPSFLDVAEPDDRLVVVHSFSKSFLMTGWRLGWLVVPEELVTVIERLAQNLFICPSTISQQAALACFEPESLAVYEERRAQFKARRDFVIPALNAMGMKVPVPPDGAFYAWADCSAACAKLGVKDSWDFAFEVMKRAHVAITPGRDFGDNNAHRYVRFTYTIDIAQLTDVVARLTTFLKR